MHSARLVCKAEAPLCNLDRLACKRGNVPVPPGWVQHTQRAVSLVEGHSREKECLPRRLSLLGEASMRTEKAAVTKATATMNGNILATVPNAHYFKRRG